MIMFTLYKTSTLSLIIIVLAHWNNSQWIDMSLHSDTLSWFQANHYWSYSLMVCASRRSSNYQFDRLCFDPFRNWTIWSTALNASTLMTITTYVLKHPSSPHCLLAGFLLLNCIVFCISLFVFFVLFLLTIVSSVLRFRASDTLFSNIQTFLRTSLSISK